MANYYNSRRSVENYFKWRIQRVKPVVKRINKIRKLKGTRVLEVGCGWGALMKVASTMGAFVTGTEVKFDSIRRAKKFLKGTKNIRIIRTQKEKLPFSDNSFDVVILFDVIEHVDKPKDMLKECIRVLKPGGILYSEFTPFYSLVGHHLYDITKLPVHLFFSEKKIKKMVFAKDHQGIFNSKDYWDDYKSLNKLRISDFQKYVRGLSKIEERYILKYPALFEVNVPALQFLGRFKDTFAFSFEGIYRKS